jgi:hypothetical protein
MAAYELPPVVSLHKYFIWCNSMRTRFDEIVSNLTPEHNWHDQESIDMNLYMSYWYGGLYVVIEGWQELQLQDPTIDGLLSSPNVDLLRRYRNGTFHYQRKYFDERFLGLIEKGVDVVTWVRSLNRAFGAYFLEWFRTHDIDGNLIPGV